ncbi:hypothetical protein Y032_0002g689 [Ancylostoma ceylanicum]|uniref:AB hydrolase-1 domain-containing protein n=1 Tax=Ancylostoma ceylanicum TaxID=53326 RepID=A0A016W1T6_9BILA|nr:hypothetical protein Y032_0002g689 [Ancylostoma ceylanicum]
MAGFRYIFMFQTPRIPELAVQSRDFHMFDLSFRGKKAGIRNKENFTDEDLEAWKHVFSQKGECFAITSSEISRKSYSDALTGPINYYRNLGKRTPMKGEQSICKPPTLIVWGDQDQFLVKEGAEMSLKYCQNAHLKFVEGASHWVMQDEPQKVNELIEEFLSTPVHGNTKNEDLSKM